MCLVWTHLILFNVDVETFVCFVLLLSTTRNYSCDVVFSDQHMHMCWCFLWFFRSFVFPNKKMFVFPNIDVLVFGNHDLSILCARCVLRTKRAQRHFFGSCCLKMTPNSQREMIVENSENKNTKKRTNFTTHRCSVPTWTWVLGTTWECVMVSGCRVSRTDTPLKDQEPSWWETTSISICHEL